jgi:hypothetical protein
LLKRKISHEKKSRQIMYRISKIKGEEKEMRKFIMRIISIQRMKIENGEDLVERRSLIIMEE